MEHADWYASHNTQKTPSVKTAVPEANVDVQPDILRSNTPRRARVDPKAQVSSGQRIMKARAAQELQARSQRPTSQPQWQEAKFQPKTERAKNS